MGGLVVYLQRDLIKLGSMSPRVMAAEHEVSATREDDAYICLGAAAVAAVEGGEEGRDWSRGGNGTCHAYLQHLAARIRSGPLLDQ